MKAMKVNKVLDLSNFDPNVINGAPVTYNGSPVIRIEHKPGEFVGTMVDGEFVKLSGYTPAKIYRKGYGMIPGLDMGLDYSTPQIGKVIASKYGPRFFRRWNTTQYVTWIAPLIQRIGLVNVNRVAWNHPARRYEVVQIRALWDRIDNIETLIRDGYESLILLALHLLPKEGCKDPLLEIKSHFSNKGWKKLLQASKTKIDMLYRRTCTNAPGWGVDFIRNLEEIPSCVIKRPRQTPYSISAYSSEAFFTAYRVLRQTKGIEACADLVSDVYNMSEHTISFQTMEKWSFRRIKEEHDKLAYNAAVKRVSHLVGKDDVAPIQAGFSEVSYSATGKYRAVMIRTLDGFIKQGISQKHCVLFYAPDAMKGDVVIYNIVDENGETVSTAMFNNRGRLMQHYGFRNAIIKEEEVLELVNNNTVDRFLAGQNKAPAPRAPAPRVPAPVVPPNVVPHPRVPRAIVVNDLLNDLPF